MALKYKVGDRVKIKSLNWYNKNKNKRGNISFPYEVEVVFTPDKSFYCGQVVTISKTGYTQGVGFYRIKEDYGVHMWTDEMIECRVEEETKFGTALNPLEIKSNANCLTQEKVDEIKPEPKFKVGDKITNGKDKLLILNIVSDKYIVEDNLGECGTVYFNTQDDWKLMEEENDDCKKCGLVHNSIRCLFMDNCPNNKQIKFNVGDVVYSTTWQRDVIIQEILPNCFYKVGDLQGLGWFKEREDNLLKVKPTCIIDSALNTEKIVLEKANTLKIQSNNMETETHRGYCTTEPETTSEGKKVAWFTFEDNDFADKVELALSNRELIQEDGKWFVVKKKKEYPKTYEECKRIMGVELWNTLWGEDATEYEEKTEDLIDAFIRLKVCRDAYWKIAGEEMGLGKPWEPDWKDDTTHKFTIHTIKDKIYSGVSLVKNYTFAFPTPEMRDAFKENFDPDIEICKELL